jgi:AmmeMemoRadiSam system protein A
MTNIENYRPLLKIARDTIAARLESRVNTLSRLPVPFDRSRGVFVTLYGPGRELRGCVGHIQATCGSLTDEVAECAIAAAFHDPRFPPLRVEELATVSIEISLLGHLERVDAEGDLDPKIYGVVVSSGARRGLLLPDLDGVDTVEMQLDIARRKAGIRSGEPVQLDRFVVEKIRE